MLYVYIHYVNDYVIHMSMLYIYIYIYIYIYKNDNIIILQTACTFRRLPSCPESSWWISCPEESYSRGNSKCRRVLQLPASSPGSPRISRALSTSRTFDIIQTAISNVLACGRQTSGCKAAQRRCCFGRGHTWWLRSDSYAE
jgi:hypothetical protein